MGVYMGRGYSYMGAQDVGMQGKTIGDYCPRTHLWLILKNCYRRTLISRTQYRQTP